MSLSLNEVEALSKKAARGAGYPWGLAEEAAKATHWLCARGMDGCGALSVLLATTDGVDLAGWRPVMGSTWAAKEGRLCPICAGTALADGLADIGQGGVSLRSVVAPLLLVPFAAQAAMRNKISLQVAWGTGSVLTDGSEASLFGETAFVADTVTIAKAETPVVGQLRTSRADPVSEVKRRLDALAYRTYAPATEESRLKGAGAGLSDND